MKGAEFAENAENAEFAENAENVGVPTSEWRGWADSPVLSGVNPVWVPGYSRRRGLAHSRRLNFPVQGAPGRI